MTGHVFRVDGRNAAGPWDGSSWATAFRTVHDALDAAEAHMRSAPEPRPEVWVAQGTYTPTDDGDRDVAFCLRSGVELLGGFAGTETARAQRDWRAHETVLSGAVGTCREEGSRHVVVGADAAVLDGFTVRDGFNLLEGPPAHHLSPEILLEARGAGVGAGILCDRAAPVIRHCVVCDNVAMKGAGLYNMVQREFPPQAPRRAALVEDCTFARNHAVARGGAVSNDLMTHPGFVACSFVDNTCDAKGGAVYNDFECSPSFISCLFARNVAHKGGGMANDGHSSPGLANCTFAYNHAVSMYGALYSGTGPTNVPNAPQVVNCVFWGNTAESGPAQIGDWHDCRTTVTFSCVQGGRVGEGNIDADPLFVDAEHGDYRLGAGSPCVDSAHGSHAPLVDRDGRPRRDDAGCPSGIYARVPYCPPGAPLPEPRADAEFPGSADMGCFERQEDSLDPSHPPVVYVDAANTAGPWDGLSWGTAFTDVQEALRVAYRGAAEVWVAAGEYPTTRSGDRRVSFRLKDGLALYGGFRGGESSRDERDWAANETVLSGDLGSPLGEAGNAFHVVVGASGAVLDGFTVRGGNADGQASEGHGGGLLNYNASSPVVAHCRFVGNSAREGGGVYNYNLSSPEFLDCSFERNRAGAGGAMVDRVGSSPRADGCRFVGNEAEWRGGAVQIDYGSGPAFSGCVFQDCRSGGHGGGLFLESVAAQLGVVGTRLECCRFVANRAALRGGALAATDAGDPVLTECSFAGNVAGEGGGAVSADLRVTVTLARCTFSGNDGGSGSADTDVGTDSRVVYEEDS